MRIFMYFYVWICWEYNRELMLGCLWIRWYINSIPVQYKSGKAAFDLIYCRQAEHNRNVIS